MSVKTSVSRVHKKKLLKSVDVRLFDIFALENPESPGMVVSAVRSRLSEKLRELVNDVTDGGVSNKDDGEFCVQLVPSSKVNHFRVRIYETWSEG